MTTGNNNAGPADNSLAVRINRWVMGISRHWLRSLLIVIGLYAFLPFAAPVLMHYKLTGPADLIYTIYNPMCHQFAFRSWFFFGEQPAYPRAAANVPGLKPFEDYAAQVNAGQQFPVDLSQWTLDLMNRAKAFEGNDQMGYKVAVCERDVAIYGSLFIGGLIYAIPFVRRKLRPVPLWLYILLGVMPIAIDGFSQLFSYPPFNLWPIRETTPAFRMLTGALFGLMNAWLAFPHLEASAHDVTTEIEHKFDRREVRQARGQ
jgi:uncharacterized membrane protein